MINKSKSSLFKMQNYMINPVMKFYYLTVFVAVAMMFIDRIAKLAKHVNQSALIVSYLSQAKARNDYSTKTSTLKCGLATSHNQIIIHYTSVT
ncbi:protein of unknown function [Moritella yayanosii]|uniref:Uncharacterized protein n=1 Tax=Moritella yayanosii TaxID=69539 RepID=A0A330LX97_9GAMM|nr:protein of unknown function [Moritella yayanosii]